MNANRSNAHDATRPRLDRRADGQLWLRWRNSACPVRVARCFPWSARSRFISLRDDEQREMLLVEDLSVLDPCSREVLEDALVEADFVFEITRIDGIGEEIEIRCWDVGTSQGPRRFQTRRDEWPRRVPGGGLLIRDVAGDLYRVRDPTMLDKKSRRQLAAFMD